MTYDEQIQLWSCIEDIVAAQESLSGAFSELRTCLACDDLEQADVALARATLACTSIDLALTGIDVDRLTTLEARHSGLPDLVGGLLVRDRQALMAARSRAGARGNSD